jgi:hypothetical protein
VPSRRRIDRTGLRAISASPGLALPALSPGSKDSVPSHELFALYLPYRPQVYAAMTRASRRVQLLFSPHSATQTQQQMTYTAAEHGRSPRGNVDGRGVSSDTALPPSGSSRCEWTPFVAARLAQHDKPLDGLGRQSPAWEIVGSADMMTCSRLRRPCARGPQSRCGSLGEWMDVISRVAGSERERVNVLQLLSQKVAS